MTHQARSMRLPGSVDVLREGSFARYIAAVTVSHLGNGMASVALAFAVLEFGSPTDLGLILLAREVPMVVFLLLGGVFADRLPRRRILVATDLLKGGAQLGTALLLFTRAAEFWNVALLQVVFGVALAFSRPVSLGLIRETVSDAHLQQANALAQLSRSTLSIVSPALGALIVTLGSPAIAIAIDAVTFLVSAALIASMGIAGTVRAATTSVVRDLRDGWHELISRPWVVAIIASFGLFQLTYFPALLVLGPTVALEHLGGAAGWGAIVSTKPSARWRAGCWRSVSGSAGRSWSASSSWFRRGSCCWRSPFRCRSWPSPPSASSWAWASPSARICT